MSRGSNTVNPITFGPDADDQAPPWLYGDHVNPQGEFCKICYNCFKHGGFAEDFATSSIYTINHFMMTC